MRTQLVYVCVLLSVTYAASSNTRTLPSFIHPCSISDPELNECAERAVALAGQGFAAGIPELGIAPLDPAQVGTIHVDNPALNLVFSNTIVTGLGGFVVNSFKMNTEKGRATFDFTANVTLKADYQMDGKVLILPIKGDGKTKIKITNLNIIIKYEYETRQGYWIVTGYKDTYKMDRAQFKFTNLFGGNKELGDMTNKFLNDNWEDIMKEVAPPAIEQIIAKCVNEVQKFFLVVPAAMLLL